MIDLFFSDRPENFLSSLRRDEAEMILNLRRFAVSCVVWLRRAFFSSEYWDILLFLAFPWSSPPKLISPQGRDAQPSRPLQAERRGFSIRTAIPISQIDRLSLSRLSPSPTLGGQ